MQRTIALLTLIGWTMQGLAQTEQIAQNSVEIIQQATPLKKPPRFDYLIKTCEVTRGSTTREDNEVKERAEKENISRTEHNYSYVYNRMNYVQTYLVPSSAVYNTIINKVYAQKKRLRPEDRIAMEENKKAMDESVKLLQLPKHGKLVIDERIHTQLLDVGSFGYIPDLNFEGNDSAVFSAKYHGENYKVVMNLRVRYGYISDSSEGIELASTSCANGYKYIKLH